VTVELLPSALHVVTVGSVMPGTQAAKKPGGHAVGIYLNPVKKDPVTLSKGIHWQYTGASVT
jgi:hypothetical protein